MTAPAAVEVTVGDGVLVARLNRPEQRNALTPEMILRLAEAWARVREDPDIRVAILTGTGSDAFSTGGDLGSLLPLLSRARPPQDHWDERFLADKHIMNKVFLRGEDLGKPLIAGVNGICLAGGTELVLLADLRVAAEHAYFGLTEVQRGLIPAAGSLARLPRQVPLALAREMILLGEPIDARRALEGGLLNQVLPSDGVMPRAFEMARRLADNGPLAVRMARQVIDEGSGVTLAEAFAAEDRAVRVVLRSGDAKEGPRAFTEKRRPVFTGR